MRVGYARIGRAMNLARDRWGYVGGDDEPPSLLRDLALRHPDDQFVIVSLCREVASDAGMPRNVINSYTPERLQWLKDQHIQTTSGRSGSDERGPIIERNQRIFNELMLPVFEGLDAIVVWAGQHGTSNTRIPIVKGNEPDSKELTNPQDSSITYAGPIIRGINHWRDVDPLGREEVWLIADARNYIKARDLKWPMRHPILGQYNFTRREQVERFGDTRSPEECGFADAKWKTNHTWQYEQTYTYSRLEVCGLMPEDMGVMYSEEHEQRSHFGLFINEARSYVKHNRRDIVKNWVLPIQPSFLHGTWPKGHEKDLGVTIDVAPWSEYYPKLQSALCTFTTPSSGSEWATTKPWQAFGVGTVCFFHPVYDKQDHILTDEFKDLREWLRVRSPEELAKRVQHVYNDRSAWLWIVREQRRLYEQARHERRHVRMIEERIWK